MAFLKHVLIMLLLLPCLVGAGLAEEYRHHRDRNAAASPGWHPEIGHSQHHGNEPRHEGRWHHGHHEGRHGWWWIVGGAWHFYPARVDAYRDLYQPPVVAVAPAAASARYWYYCFNPAGYYPYVARCAVNWQRVSATAPLR